MVGLQTTHHMDKLNVTMHPIQKPRFENSKFNWNLWNVIAPSLLIFLISRHWLPWCYWSHYFVGRPHWHHLWLSTWRVRRFHHLYYFQAWPVYYWRYWSLSLGTKKRFEKHINLERFSIQANATFTQWTPSLSSLSSSHSNNSCGSRGSSRPYKSNNCQSYFNNHNNFRNLFIRLRPNNNEFSINSVSNLVTLHYWWLIYDKWTVFSEVIICP